MMVLFVSALNHQCGHPAPSKPNSFKYNIGTPTIPPFPWSSHLSTARHYSQPLLLRLPLNILPLLTLLKLPTSVQWGCTTNVLSRTSFFPWYEICALDAQPSTKKTSCPQLKPPNYPKLPTPYVLPSMSLVDAISTEVTGESTDPSPLEI